MGWVGNVFHIGYKRQIFTTSARRIPVAQPFAERAGFIASSTDWKPEAYWSSPSSTASAVTRST